MTITPAALKAAAEGDFKNAIVASTPGGIEAQEAAGQRALVSNFSKLPKNMDEGSRKTAEKLGFVFGADIDDVFVSVTPPAGWSLSATGHSMHNDVLDATGAKRASMFYKAAFYDRRADLYWLKRYQVRTDWDRYQDAVPSDPKVYVRVWDGKSGAAVWSAETPDTGNYNEVSDRVEPLQLKAKAHLQATFPDHDNPTAYW